MPFFHYSGIKISAMAAAVPVESIGINAYREQYDEKVIDRYVKMTGIRSHRRTHTHQTVSDRGFAAAEKILNEKRIDRSRIHALVFGSHSMDYRMPATACVLQRRLRLSQNCAAFDINLGCSAMTYGMQAICSMMNSSDIDCALLIVGESMSKITNPMDRSVNMLFGDGGGAVLFERESDEKIISIQLETDGSGYRTIVVPAGGFRNMNAPAENMEWRDGNTRSLNECYMNGTGVFVFSLTDVPKTVKEFWERTRTSAADYDCFAFHQANLLIQKELAKKLEIPMDKMPLCLDRYGNTGPASTLLALCDAYGEKRGGTLNTLFCCFGVGLSWGVASVELQVDDIFPIIETDDYFEEGVINAPF